MEFSTFPKNLAYKISQLQGFSKTSVKLTPDRTDVGAGETFRVKMPSNTIVDLRTFALHAKGSATQDSGSDKMHFPRNGLSSCIKTLGLYINGTLIERIDNYNILYNKLYDLDAGSDQDAKRGVLENADASVGYKLAPTSGANDYQAGDPVIRVNNNAPADTDMKMMVNNWLGFLSTASTPCVDTNDLNVVEVEITLSDANVLWSSGDGTASTAPTTTGATYSLKDIHFTISKIIFTDALYYNLKASRLLSSGLNIGYSTYISSKLSTTAKGTSMNMMTTVNSTSLDQLICCFNPATPTITTLRLQGANNVNAGKTFKEAGVDPAAGQAYWDANPEKYKEYLASKKLKDQKVTFVPDEKILKSKLKFDGELFEGRLPDYRSVDDVIFKEGFASKDGVVNANVLNVIEDEIERANVVRQIAQLISNKGMGIITTRGDEVAKVAEEAIKNKSKSVMRYGDGYILGKGTASQTFQKGFGKEELLKYIQDILGKGFKVEKIPTKYKIGSSGVIIKKIKGDK